MTRQVKEFISSIDPDEEPFPLRFRCINVKTGETIGSLDVAAAANPGAGADFAVTSIVQYVEGRQVTDLNGIKRFFQRVLVDDGYERLLATLESKDVAIDSAQLGKAMNYLIEEYSGRPTVQPSASSAGLPSTGAPLTALASSPA